VNSAIGKLNDRQFVDNVGRICSLDESQQWEIYQVFYRLNAGN